MTDPYIEDDGAEFSFNNCVRCGQTEYQSGFGEDPVQTGKIKSTAPKGRKPNSFRRFRPGQESKVRPNNPVYERGFLCLMFMKGNLLQVIGQIRFFFTNFSRPRT
jgi:hypothetical protein